MKIIQTLWIPENEEIPLKFKGGWVSPEFHWLSWTLSVLQLRKFYDEVELYTNKAGKEILINQLNLPYTKVHETLNEVNIKPNTWALSKIITYSLQKEPFLHIDGDVFIWKPFDEALLNSQLIAQNKEIDFPFYSECLEKIVDNFEFLPDIFKNSSNMPTISYNAGIFGGNDINFIQKYAQMAIDFVLKNHDCFVENAPIYCMVFEQWLLGALTEEAGIKVNTYINEPAGKEGYSTDLSEFLEVPTKRSYLHLMSLAKHNYLNLKKFLTKFQREYPEYYYRILKLCAEKNISLDFKIYQLNELNPLRHDTNYFLKLLKKRQTRKPLNEKNKWKYHFKKDIYVYGQLEGFYQIGLGVQLLQKMVLYEDFELIEEHKEEIKYKIRLADTSSLTNFDAELDNLSYVLIRCFSKKPQVINQIIEKIKPCFDSSDFQDNIIVLQQLVIEKIKRLMYLGALKWVF